MANKPLKTIKFPGLADTYTIPQIDTTLAVAGKAADSKATGDRFDAVEADVTALQAELPDLTETVMSAFATDTASGAIATFPDGADNVPVKALTVEIEPVQDLHGQTSPYPAGGGANQFDVNSSFTFPVTFSGITFNVSDSVVILNGTAETEIGINALEASLEENTAYTASVTGLNTDTKVTLQGYKSGEFVGTIDVLTSGTPSLTINTSTTYDMIRARPTALNGATLSNFKLYIQVEKGSTATAWEPYSNICPISGWSEAKVTRTSENKLALADKQMDSAGLIGSVQDKIFTLHGTLNGYYDRYFDSDFIPEGTYVVSGLQPLPTGYTWYIYDTVSGARLLSSNDPNGTEVTISSSNKYRFGLIVSQQGLNVNIKCTPTLSAVADTYTIDLSGTRYGGTLDVGTGVLTVDKAFLMLNGSENWNKAGTPNNHFRYGYPRDDVALWVADTFSVISNQYATETPSQTYSGLTGISTNTASNTIFICDERFSTVEEFKTYLSTAGVEVCYRLATPQTVQLTAEQVTTLLGTNNIFADCGDVEVEYRADTKLYIDKLLNA